MYNFEHVLKEIMRAKGLSASKIANFFGQSEKSIYNYTSGKNEPTYSKLRALALNIEGINCRWLLTGEGEMILKKENPYTLEEPLVSFGGNHTMNNGAVGGDMVTNINNCKHDLELARLELSELKKRLMDKEEIIELLKKK